MICDVEVGDTVEVEVVERAGEVFDGGERQIFCLKNCFYVGDDLVEQHRLYDAFAVEIPRSSYLLIGHDHEAKDLRISVGVFLWVE